MHILIVEDERTLCETIVRSLRRLAYSVDFCYDGNEALNLLAVEKYDLVLLDLNLPGADGMTVLRQLRQTDKDTRVLILSARCRSKRLSLQTFSSGGTRGTHTQSYAA